MDRPGALGAIGNTPVVRLDRLGRELFEQLDGRRRLGEGTRVATIQVDSGLKCLAGELYS